MRKKQACVLVAGSWGTALAVVLADNGYSVKLWTRHTAQAEEINTAHRNSRFHPDVPLPESITATTSIEGAVQDCDIVLIVAPSHAMRQVARQIQGVVAANALIIHATKGFESDSLQTMSTVIAEELPEQADRIVVLSGPSHAEEVIQRSPTTVVVASRHAEAAKQAQDLLINKYFRVYTNSDIVGVELGGALKNIIAIGAGLSDGLGFGDNAKAALLTRGLAEITRLGIAMGASPLTFAGLAGMGDLAVTCTSQHSRNWRAGYLLGQGHSLSEVLDSMGMVVEGVRTTKSAYALAAKFDVEMPITEQLFQVLFEHKRPKHAVEDLMGRGRTHEMEEFILNPHARD